MRCAIYFIPPKHDPLTLAATRWIGRDAYGNEQVEPGTIEGLVEEDRAFLTAPVRRFGFHGTLRAPFQLVEGHTLDALSRALGRFAKSTPSILVPHIEIAALSNFFCLVPRHPSHELDALAFRIVETFDGYRAPMSEAELERRYPVQLTERQHANLLAWGHPYVGADYRFHMSLTGPVPPEERAYVRAVLERHFGALLCRPLVVDQIALFYESEPLAPMRIHSVHSLMQAESRRRA